MFANAPLLPLFGLFCHSTAERHHVVTSVVIRPDAFTLDDYKAMVRAGVGRLVLGTNIASPNGTVVVDSKLNKTFMDEIHNLTKDTDTEVFLAVFPMLENAGTQKFSHSFSKQMQHYFKEFHLDGALVQPTLSPEALKELQYIGDALRSTYSWKLSRGKAGLMFDTTESNWDILASLAPNTHYDFAVCLIDMHSPVEIANTKAFAESMLDKWNNATRSPAMLEFGIIPEGRQAVSNAESYRDLVKQGAPVTGDGKFNGFYYDSQTQINEKAEIVKGSSMVGITFFGADADLPASDNRSLVAAALAAFRA